MIVIGGVYKDKITGEICKPLHLATCKNRGVEVVVYSGDNGNRYTINASELESSFECLKPTIKDCCTNPIRRRISGT